MDRSPTRGQSRVQPRCVLRPANELLDPSRPRRGVACRVVAESDRGTAHSSSSTAMQTTGRSPALPRSTATPHEFCREARRLRAVFEHDPVRMHRHLSRLSVTAAADGSAAPAQVPEARPSTPLRWTWARTSHLGKNGISLLTQMGLGLSMAASEEPSDALNAAEDDYPRYTLVDPFDPPLIDEGYPGTPDQTFIQLVARTLLKPNAPVLRYSQRLSLLKEAGRRGIGRFEANLMIASVQHRVKRNVPAPETRRMNLSGWVAFVLVQSSVVLGAWRLIRT